MAFRPYLAFSGNARQAFTRYQEIFGGELVLLDFTSTPPDAGPPPEGAKGDAIMHAALMTPDGLLMGADDPSGNFSGSVSGMCCNASLPDPGEARRVFDALADHGTVQVPIGETFFSPAFGMCIDQFGTPWQIMVDSAMPS